MKPTQFGRTATLTLLAFTPLVGQTIDFIRQVRPILSDKCYFCHGPAQQMGGLRFDRKESALRVVRPVNSGSALVHRITSQDASIRMPPWTPVFALSPADIGTLKAWVEQGAPWPEDAAPSAALEGVFQAIARRDLSSLRMALRDRSLKDGRDSAGATALMHAAFEGDLLSMKVLLEAGADPNASNDVGATALVWAAGDLAKVRFLLSHGAKPNQKTREGVTPLIAAAMFRGSAPVLTALLDAGADPNAANNDGFTALVQAASIDDIGAMRLLITHGAKVNPQLAGENPQVGALSPLNAAAYFGTADSVQFLLDRGAKVNAPDGFGFTALHFAANWEEPRMLAALIRAGADVNLSTPATIVSSDDPGTPLMLAANSESGKASITSQLLARGARVDAVSREGETALSRAQKRGRTPLVEALVAAGARTGGEAAALPTAPGGNPAPDIRTAVEKSLALLQKSNRQFQQRVGCQSCHNNALLALATRMADEFGFRFDREMALTSANATKLAMAVQFEKAIQMMDPDGGSPTSTSFALLTRNGPGDPASYALVRNIAARQLPDGRWRPPFFRAPMENDVTTTAIAMRAIQLYAPAARKGEYEKKVRAAAEWLSGVEPCSTEERTFQLLGLSWANGDATQLRRRATQLWNEQRRDGGWGQLSSLASDAYATGEVLYALSESGMLGGHDAGFERGVRFLLKTQQPDGSWFVRSRAIRFQQHFESGFPYGKDQFISAAGTSWAAMALMLGRRHGLR